MLFGRSRVLDDAEILLEGNGVTISRVDLAYFDREGAIELVQAYATDATSGHHDYPFRKQPKAARTLIDAYFAAIASALGLSNDSLWDDAVGQAFVGYAPVLAALGQLLAYPHVNFRAVEGKLRKTGGVEAWTVLEEVANQIVDRERDQVHQIMSSRGVSAVPAAAYDREEQFAMLAQYAQTEPWGSSPRVALVATAASVYDEIVQERIPEHPFLRKGALQPVLGAMVLGYALAGGLILPKGAPLLRAFSDQPFLWRSFRPRLSAATATVVIHGHQVGFVLNSLWNDPLPGAPHTVVRDLDDLSGATLLVDPGDNGVRSFEFMRPLELFAQLRDADIETDGVVVLEGVSSSDTAESEQGTFRFSGDVSLHADTLAVRAAHVLVDDAASLDARLVEQPASLALHPSDEPVCSSGVNSVSGNRGEPSEHWLGPRPARGTHWSIL